MINKDEITRNLRSTGESLFTLVKAQTINQISNAVYYVVDSVTPNNFIDLTDPNYKVKMLQSSKLTFDNIVDIIYSEQSKISWVDLTILFSDIERTIIHVTLVKVNKKEREIDYHCAIRLPRKHKEGVKFDLNNV